MTVASPILRARALPRRRPIPLLLPVLAVLLWPGSSADAQLCELRYRQFGEEESAVGEVFISDGELVEIRLFSEQLSQYYTVRIPTGDLISARTLSREDAEMISAVREAKIQEKERRREERRRQREAEREARKDREVKKKGRSRISERRRRPSRSEDRGKDEEEPQAKVVPMAVPSPEETLEVVQETLETVAARLNEVRGAVDGQWRRLQELDRPSAKAAAALRRLRQRSGEAREKIARSHRRLEGRAQEVSRFASEVEGKKMKPRAAEQRALYLFRQLENIERDLERAEKLVAQNEEALANTPVSEPETEELTAETRSAAATPRESGSVVSRGDAAVATAEDPRWVVVPSDPSPSDPTPALSPAGEEVTGKVGVARAAADLHETEGDADAPSSRAAAPAPDERGIPFVPAFAAGLAAILALILLLAARSQRQRSSQTTP